MEEGEGEATASESGAASTDNGSDLGGPQAATSYYSTSRLL